MINLCEILKEHEGETFYSPMFGDVTLIASNNGNVTYPIQILPIDCTDRNLQFNKNGMFWGEDYPNGECMLFPSKDQRDWNKWIEEQKPKTPKTWSEFIKNRAGKLGAICDWGNSDCSFTEEETPIEKSVLALLKIHQLIEVGYGRNVSKEEWECPINSIYWIRTDGEEFHIETEYDYPFAHIAFHTKEQAEEFLSYSENIQLLKDYFMI